MPYVPEIEEEDGSFGETATRHSLTEDELSQAAREVGRLSRDLERPREQIRTERADHEHLLAVVSHELRTPITVVGGFLRLLLAEGAGPLGEEQRCFLMRAQRACEKLGAFTKRLLEGARVPLCAGALDLRPATLGPVFTEVAAAYREALTARELSLVDDIDPSHVARFDSDTIERVLSNLIDNAIRFADQRIVVTTRRLCDNGRAFVEVSVVDDGPGVREADCRHIFAPYVRGEDAGSEGLGLGLALCQRLVEAHEGQIGLAASPGGGSRFSFTLPSEG